MRGRCGAGRTRAHRQECLTPIYSRDIVRVGVSKVVVVIIMGRCVYV